MEPYPEKYLPDTVTVRRLTGHDEFGTPTYDPPLSSPGTPYRARVVHRSREVFSAVTGQVIHESGFALIVGDPPPAISTDDQVTLPDGSTPPIIEAMLARDAEGEAHHTKIIFG